MRIADGVVVLVGVGLIVGAIAGAMWGFPQYSVWQQEMSGKAALAKATQDRQIKVQEAQALKESAKYYADAEVIRAEGVSKANKIIAGGLKGNDEYLRYLWINAMGEKDDKATFYIPTGQDGLPMMKPIQ